MDEGGAGRIRWRLNFAEFLEIGAPDVGAKGKIHEFPVPCGLNKASGLEFLYMVREGRGSDTDVFAKIGASHAPSRRNALKYLETGGISDGAGDLRELTFGQRRRVGTCFSSHSPILTDGEGGARIEGC